MDKRLTLTIMVALFLGWMSEFALAKYGGGTGEPNDPYQIWDANHMQAIGTDPCDWDKHFVLMADIDLSQFDGSDGREKFNIIGNDWDDSFVGVFDGNDHAISGFSYYSNDRDYLGLFGYVSGPNAKIKNLFPS